MPDDPLPSVMAVTSADADHFDLALELILSLRRFSSLGSIKLGMLDVGLTDGQRELLLAREVTIAQPRWEFDGEPPPQMPRGCLAMLSRPFLPRYFPAANVFVSLDSDTWVQMESGITDLAAGAMRSDIAVVPEMHPSYAHLYKPQHANRKEHRSTFAAVYGQDLPFPADNIVLNAGVFAARSDSPLWNVWSQSLAAALSRVRDGVLSSGKPLFSVWHPIHHFIEQNALNHAFYAKGLRLYPMSALYNFICTLSQPLFDADIKKLVEPTAPFAPIRIIHLTGAGKRTTQVFDRDRHSYARGLRYSDWQEMIAGQ
ncbi:MAG: hypothetical protein ABSH22_13880 [Tepidisphaeraceae bacterium]|jgi:hypothetical protein